MEATADGKFCQRAPDFPSLIDLLVLYRSLLKGRVEGGGCLFTNFGETRLVHRVTRNSIFAKSPVGPNPLLDLNHHPLNDISIDINVIELSRVAKHALTISIKSTVYIIFFHEIW